MADNIISKIFRPSERGRVWQIFALIVVLTIVGIMIDAPQYYNKGVLWLSDKSGQAINLPEIKGFPFHLGLDLIGGTHLIYQADMSEIPSGDQASTLEGVRDVIERRVNVFGVSEPIVQTSYSGGEPRVIVELAGISDVNKAITMIGETPLLEFKEQSTETRELSEQERQQMEEINQNAKVRAEEVLGKLLSGGDFKALADEYNRADQGGVNTDLGWLTFSSQNPALDYVKELEKGEYTQELIETPNALVLYKLEDKRLKSNPFNDNETEKEVRASHILLCHNEIESCPNGLSKDEAYAKIKDIKAQANPKNFSDLAREYSTGPSAGNGGDLGWFDKTQMVKPFADTVFAQELNTISYVVETEFGYHLIYKQEERKIEEFKISQIVIPIITEADITGNQQNWENTELSGKHLEKAFVSFNPNDNQAQVSLKFDSEGSDLFADITGRNVEKPVAIFLDDFIISAPTVNEKITGGEAVISGGFNINEAKLLAQRLNAGALPVPINLLSQQTVGPSLGKASLEASLYAGLIGLILVAVFIILMYRLAGFLAVISLLIYGVLVLALFKIWPVTLTLSGIAGFILSIGMAVDANVLIFERLKEELSEGKPLSRAVLDAFDRAWPSIRDGNVSTLITCFILIQFTTSIVKGFAITLGLGVLISMFSAIVITKTLLQLSSITFLENKLWLVGGKK
ncbi:MAG: protein translocase subunit SecD [Patescibacteria group bacterium]|nr:protein translocase subunit SecD [Patescibacteria group bacterium]